MTARTPAAPPAAPGAPGAEHPVPAPRARAEPVRAPAHGAEPAARTVLVVDDDPLDAERARHVLVATGVTVLVAHDAAAALALAARGVDLVVTDVSMPGTDGPALVGVLRRAGCPAPVLAVTSDPTDGARRRCLAAGALACLGKPVHDGSLGALSSAVLAGGAAAVAGPPDDAPDDDGLDDDLRARLRGSYLAELPRRCTALALATGPQEVAAAAHALAGPSAQFGFPALAALCRAVERRARAGHGTADLVRAVLDGAHAVPGQP